MVNRNENSINAPRVDKQTSRHLAQADQELQVCEGEGEVRSGSDALSDWGISDGPQPD